MEMNSKLKMELSEMNTEELRDLVAYLDAENDHLAKEYENAKSEHQLDIWNDIKDNNTKKFLIDQILEERSISKNR